jgi:hypothetical protein
MKHLFLSITFLFGAVMLYAQNAVASDSTKNNNVIVNKDPRLDVLAKKEAEFNDANMVLSGGKYVRGYRLMLLSTSDKALALKIRSKLLQNFPDQKVYMSFQPPYIKLKFGDFLDKDEADKYKTDISNAEIISGNIYIVPDLVENKQDKIKQTTSP